jgi:nucleoside transporter
MPSESMSLGIRARLSAMMFLQYMLLPVWFLPLAAYLTKLEMSATQKAWILSSMALGCLASPLVGMVADRHFASEKVLAALNLLAAILLVASAQTTDPTLVFVLLLAVMLCYMPTWGLTSAIAMSNSPAEKFPQIRVFGSIGWVASGIFSLVAGGLFDQRIDGTAVTLYCGAGTALVAAAFALLLPHTPPPAKGQKASVLDVLGLRSLVLLKDLRFAVFLLTYFLVMFPFSMYWSYCSEFLQNKGFEYITVTMNWGQVAEMGFMLMIPLVLARVGLKWAMIIGLVAMVVRYLAFLLGGMLDMTWLYFVAILVHGLIFGFYFVGAQIYVDRKAPKELRAQAQGFLFLAGFGVGLLVGNFINGELIARNSTLAMAVPDGFRLPADAALPADMVKVPGAAVSDVRFYGRVLDDKEVEVLAAGNDEKKANNLIEEAKRAGVSVNLDKDLVYEGNLAGLAGRNAPAAMTFAAQFVLPEKVEGKRTSGTLFEAGEGKDALKLAIKDDVLALQAGDREILARAANLPFGKKEGKDQPVHIAGTLDGREFKLFIGGVAYRIYDWQPIWLVTTISSAVLLLVFATLFRDDTAATG